MITRGALLAVLVGAFALAATGCVSSAGGRTLNEKEAAKANLQLGVAYLRRLLDRYDGNLPAALAAYNWGPGHIDGRLRDGTPLPVDYKDLVLRAYDRHTQRS